MDWRYYNDGKAWLTKGEYKWITARGTNKIKPIFWLSIWEGFFKTTLFFLERHLEGIAALDISEQIKDDFCRMKPVGKLLPMQINFDKREQLADMLKIVRFKKGAK